MNKLFLPLFAIVLIGAGCLGAKETNTLSDAGVFKTLNAGTEWAQFVLVPTARGVGTLATTDVINLEMDPQDSQFLYASTRNNGMLMTEDGGLTWRQPRQKVLQEGTIYDIEVDPKAVCTVYAVTERKLVSTKDCFHTMNDETYLENRADVGPLKVSVDWFNTNHVWLGLSNGDVVKSENQGGQWKTVLSTGHEISEVLVSNADTRQALVSTFSHGIWRTLDGGATWAEVVFPEDLTGAAVVYSLVQNPDASVVIATTEYGLIRSRDFGLTWEGISLLTSPAEVVIRSAAIDPVDSNILYYATPGTFYRSKDGGTTWETQRLQTTRDARAILVDPSDRAVLYIGVATPTI